MKFPRKITRELAEETGWHIGDGSMNFYKNHGKVRGVYQLRGHISDDKNHYITRIKPFFKTLYNLDISLREMPSTRVFGFQIWNDELVNFKHKLGLPLGKKTNVEIPKGMLNKKENVISVIRGIFDTDGCIYLERKNKKLYPRIEISTISLNLAKQLHFLLNDLGFRATYYSVIKKQKNRKTSYLVSVRGEKMADMWFRIIKPANSKHVKKFAYFNDSKTFINC